MIRIGGPIFTDSEDPVELARIHTEMGFSAAYLPRIKDPARFKDALAAFAQSDIVIAEVGAYSINILDTDEKLRAKNVDTIKQRLRLAEEIGALCCVIHGGTVQTGGWGAGSAANFSKESFDKTVTTVQAILDDVQPRAAKLVMETESYVLPDGPDEYAALLKAIDRPGFGVHFDPVNITNSPRRFFLSGDFLRRCFELLGPHIVCAHAKDAVIGKAATVHIDECAAGEGQLDYPAYMRELAKLHQPPKMLSGGLSRTLVVDLKKFYAKQSPPLMLEHLASIEQCRKSRDFLFRIAKDIGEDIWNGELAKLGV